jgi:hypothetical protein
MPLPRESAGVTFFGVLEYWSIGVLETAQALDSN